MTIQGNVIELTKFLEINKSNYLERDNGELQYTWVVHPNVLSLGTQMLDDLHKMWPILSIVYKWVEKQG